MYDKITTRDEHKKINIPKVLQFLWMKNQKLLDAKSLLKHKKLQILGVNRHHIS